MMLRHRTAFRQRNRRRAGDQIYCTENRVCLGYVERCSENAFTKFTLVAPQLGLAGLGFGFVFFITEAEVIVPSPSRVSRRAAGDHSPGMGSSAAGWVCLHECWVGNTYPNLG